MLIEYKVRPVTRYIVTRFESTDTSGSTEQRGEFDNEMTAYQVAYALCHEEHQRVGWKIDDARMKYPEHPDSKDTVQVA